MLLILAPAPTATEELYATLGRGSFAQHGSDAILTDHPSTAPATQDFSAAGNATLERLSGQTGVNWAQATR